MAVSACLCSPLQEGLHLLGSPARQQIGDALAQLARACVRGPLLLESQAQQPLILPPVPNPAGRKLLGRCSCLVPVHDGQVYTAVTAVQTVFRLCAKCCCRPEGTPTSWYWPFPICRVCVAGRQDMWTAWSLWTNVSSRFNPVKVSSRLHGHLARCALSREVARHAAILCWWDRCAALAASRQACWVLLPAARCCWHRAAMRSAWEAMVSTASGARHSLHHLSISMMDM